MDSAAVTTVRLESLDGPLEWPEGDVPALLSVLARARTSHTIPASEIGDAVVDVGGAGVPYGMVRVRRGDRSWRIDEPRAAAILAAHAPPSPAAEAAPSPPPAAQADRPGPIEPATTAAPMRLPAEPDAPDRVDLILSVLRRKITGGSEVVSDEDFQAVGKWITELNNRGYAPLLEAAAARILRDSKTPPLLKSRLAQHLAEFALPEAAQALDEAMNEEPALRKILESPRVARFFQEKG